MGQGVVTRGRWLGLLFAVFAAAMPAAYGEALGNVDGVLTWTWPEVLPGSAVRCACLFAFAPDYESLQASLESVALPQSPAEPDGAQEPDGEVTWLSNGATDFALDAGGAFFWEGRRQALTCGHGGQLSRFGYWVRGRGARPISAGTDVRHEGHLEGLQMAQPVRACSGHEAVGIAQTRRDEALRITMHAAVLDGATAAVMYAIENMGAAPVTGLEFSVYANLEAAHSHEQDFAVLDRALDGVLVLDPPTGLHVAMAGRPAPARGHVGTWASEEALRNGLGRPYAEWVAYAGLPEGLTEQLARASIPHPPAPLVEAATPPVRVLTPEEEAAALEADWLFQAEGEPFADRARKEIDWGVALAARVAALPGGPAVDKHVQTLHALRAALDGASDDEARDLYLEVRRVKRAIQFSHPALDFQQVLFIDNPYPQGAEWPHEARHRNGMMAVPGGRLLVLEGLRPGGMLRQLAPDRPGSFWRPDLSFNADRVVFCFKPHDEPSFHLYEVRLDGSGLRQLTFGPYDDLDPIYLPDGHLMFSTTRCNTYVRCMPYTYSYVLARCDGDGGAIALISRGNEPDYLPTLLDDGRVIYTRWEYTDKALWRIQSLWTVNPDGTNTAVYWGNQSVWPDMQVEPRPIPGTRRVMFTGAAHHNWFAGSIGILDPEQGLNFPAGLTKVTADVAWPESGNGPVDPVASSAYHTAGAYDAYKTPYPISQEDFLVSARRGDKYRLYLMDIHGNRELIYEGAHHIWHAFPVRPRPRPPVQPDRVAWPHEHGGTRKPGVLYSANVYQGAPAALRGKAKHLRVIQMDARTYSTWVRDVPPNQFSGPVTSILQADGVRRILGTAPVAPDGSVSFRVPAGKALHFQLLDEHFRALQTMRSFTGVMPGERRGCLGCHEMHSAAPVSAPSPALARAPVPLTPPPWGTQSLGYERFVQPVLDQCCGKCHQGEGKARKTLDMTLRPGKGVFKEPYVTLVEGGFAGALMAEGYDQRDPAAYTTLPPMAHLAYRSRLVANAMTGDHHGVRVDPASLRRLIAWVDANCPYRGEPEVRAIEDPDFMGIEALPVRPLCATAPVVQRP